MLALVGASMMVLSRDRVSAKQEPTAIPDTITSIEGTIWAGTDSDGDFYEYTFLKGGHLNYKTNTARKEIETILDKGIWAQNGQIVIVVINKYSTMVGTLSGDRIEGDAWNVTGRRWTWKVNEKH
jgi:hypothetical protein